MSDPDSLREDSDDDTIQGTWAAVQEGLQVVHLPPTFEPGDLPRLLRDVAPARKTIGVIEGKLSAFVHYAALHSELARRSVTLINDPEEHLTCLELDRAIPLLGELTPRTAVVGSMAGLGEAIEHIGLPAFIKGSVLSLKHLGWNRCVANNEREAQAITRMLLEDPSRSRGKVLVRELVALKRGRVSQIDFPPAREFRVVLYRKQIIACAFYWPWLLDFAEIDEDEAQEIFEIAQAAAERIPTPYICVDVGQLEDDRWTVIEVGDPQMSQTSLIDRRKAWRRLREVITGFEVL